MANKEFNNILDAYDNLNKEEVNKSNEDVSKAKGVDEQSPANAQEEPKEPEKVEGTKEQHEENQKDQENLEGQDSNKEENNEGKEDEEVEKSAKESKDPVDNKDTKTEDKDNKKRKNKDEDSEDEDSEDEEDKEEKSKDKDKKSEDKKKEEKTSKSISDEQITKGFDLILKSLEDINEEKEKFVTKSDLKEIKDSINDINEKINASEEPISKSNEEAPEDEEPSNEEDVVQKSATAETVGKGEKAQGVVSKSIEGETAVQEAPQEPEVEESKDDSGEIRNAFMKQFTEYAKRSPRNKELEVARQDFINYQNGTATEKQVENIKRFAGLQ